MADPDEDDPFTRLAEAFRANPLHALLGLEFVDDPDPDVSVVSMPVRPEAFGTTGSLHGGAVATLIDVSAAAAAAASSSFRPGENALVTVDLHVRYLGRPHGDMVFARSRVIRAGNRMVVVESRVVDPEGNVIAAADFASMIVPLRKPLPGAPYDPRSPEM